MRTRIAEGAVLKANGAEGAVRAYVSAGDVYRAQYSDCVIISTGK